MISKDLAMQLIHDCGYEVKPLQFHQELFLQSTTNSDYLYVGCVDGIIQSANIIGIADFKLRGNIVREICISIDPTNGTQNPQVYCIFNELEMVACGINFFGYRMKI